jgi:hypothetical protein
MLGRSFSGQHAPERNKRLERDFESKEQLVSRLFGWIFLSFTSTTT